MRSWTVPRLLRDPNVVVSALIKPAEGRAHRGLWAAWLAYAVAFPRFAAEPDGHHIPASEPGSRRWNLPRDDAVQQRPVGVRIRTGQQQAGVMTGKPGIERLHATKVRDLDLSGHRWRRRHRTSPLPRATAGMSSRPRSRAHLCSNDGCETSNPKPG